MVAVLYSPGFGAGWATWNENGKALAEDAELVAMVRAGKHIGDCTPRQLYAAGAPGYDLSFDEEDGESMGCSLEFAIRACQISGGRCYFGGVSQLKVAEVSGQYRIYERDGFEGIIERDAEEGWW